jgi:hypothetical protein
MSVQLNVFAVDVSESDCSNNPGDSDWKEVAVVTARVGPGVRIVGDWEWAPCGAPLRGGDGEGDAVGSFDMN